MKARAHLPTSRRTPPRWGCLGTTCTYNKRAQTNRHSTQWLCGLLCLASIPPPPSNSHTRPSSLGNSWYRGALEVTSTCLPEFRGSGCSFVPAAALLGYWREVELEICQSSPCHPGEVTLCSFFFFAPELQIKRNISEWQEEKCFTFSQEAFRGCSPAFHEAWKSQ